MPPVFTMDTAVRSGNVPALHAGGRLGCPSSNASRRPNNPASHLKSGRSPSDDEKVDGHCTSFVKQTARDVNDKVQKAGVASPRGAPAFGLGDLSLLSASACWDR